MMQAGDLVSRMRSGAAALILLAGGPAVWGAHQAILYGVHALLCIRAPASVQGYSFQAFAVITTAVALAVIGAVLAFRRSFARAAASGGPEEKFYRGAAALLWLLSAAGVAFNGLVALMLPACTLLR